MHLSPGLPIECSSLQSALPSPSAHLGWGRGRHPFLGPFWVGSVDESWKHASHPLPQLLGIRHLSLSQGSWGLLSHVGATCRASGMCWAASRQGWSSLRGRRDLCPRPLNSTLQWLGPSLPEPPGIWVHVVAGSAASLGCRNLAGGGGGGWPGPWVWVLAAAFWLCNWGARAYPYWASGALALLSPGQACLQDNEGGVGKAPRWVLQQPCLLSLHPGGPQDRPDLLSPMWPRPELRDSEDRTTSQLSVAGDK